MIILSSVNAAQG